jgi:hypothetical protein
MRRLITRTRLLALSAALLMVMATSCSGWYETCIYAKAVVDTSSDVSM